MIRRPVDLLFDPPDHALEYGPSIRDFDRFFGGANALVDYLVRVTGCDEKWVEELGWRFRIDGPCVSVLMPVFENEDLPCVQLVAVREVSGYVPGSRPITFGDWEDVMSGRWAAVTTLDGWHELDDVPVRFNIRFEHDTLWVTRNAAHALWMMRHGFGAISLAAPAESLGSVERLYQFTEAGLLSLARGTKKRVTIVDPYQRLAPRQGAYLRSVFGEVWEAPHLADLSALEREQEEVNVAASAVGKGFRAYLPVRDLPPRAAAPDVARETAPRVPLSSEPATDLVESVGETEWVAKPFAAVGAITDLYGAPKDGKTTFLLGLARAVAEGAPFLGEPCARGPVLYVTEQTREMFSSTLRLAGEVAAGVHVVAFEKLAGRSFPEIVAFLRDECRRLGCRLVVVDTLFAVASVWGEEENSAGTARRIYHSLRELSADGVAVVVVRHSRKSGGDIVNAAAGSVAFAAQADQLFRFSVLPSNLKFDGRVRRAEAVSRLGLVDLYVRFDDDGRGWSLVSANGARSLGSPDDAPEPAVPEQRATSGERPRKTTIRETVLAVLGGAGPEALTVSKLVEKMAEEERMVKAKNLYPTLKALEAEGVVGLIKEEGKPARYQLSSFSSPPPPSGGAGKE